MRNSKPFEFHKVTADWGLDFPDGDYTIGRGADPRGKSPIKRRKTSASQLRNQDAESKDTTEATDEQSPEAVK